MKNRHTQIQDNRGRIEVHRINTIDEEYKYTNPRKQMKNRSTQI